MSTNTRERISTNINAGFGEALSKFQTAINKLQQTVTSSTGAVSSSVDTVITETAREIDQIASTCLDAGRSAVGAIDSAAGNAVSFARNAKNTAASTGASIRSRLIKTRNSINVDGTVGSIGSKIETVLQSSKATQIITLVVGVAIAFALVYLMYKIYGFLLRSKVLELKEEIGLQGRLEGARDASQTSAIKNVAS